MTDRERLRVALLGGSFNPPHLGHQMLCLWALSTDRADQVWLLPCYQHAFSKRLVAFDDRLAMCRGAVAPLPGDRVLVSDIESRLGAPSRTLNTVTELTSTHPDHRFSLLIGADILEEKDSWYRFDEIERMVEILVVGREGYANPPGVPVMPNISSTEIRQRLRAGEPVAHLVSAAVLEMIEARGLYNEQANDG